MIDQEAKCGCDNYQYDYIYRDQEHYSYITYVRMSTIIF